jgi:hypothetical protein
MSHATNNPSAESVEATPEKRATAERCALASGSVEHVSQVLTLLWWNEYDTAGAPFVFDAIESALRVLGQELPNFGYGGRSKKWGKQAPTMYSPNKTDQP